MPRQSEAMKDVLICVKLWGVDKKRRSTDVRMGEPTLLSKVSLGEYIA